ncbi:MAG TPA: histidine--tRNA ligase [Chlamydiales bacterium]|nr:histidine--tRNA ligase [Chlamydiales bacterium]
MQLQIPKGTFDVLPAHLSEPWTASSLWQYVEETIRKTAADYGYGEIRTPIYERTELFDRGVGETSDIVTKEMFTFLDKGGRSMSLRPEGTSSVVRSFIEHRLANFGSVHKFFYIGPMFRYERPQSGRYRQHHQFGVEAIGVAAPEQDAETIDLLLEIYTRLGIKGLKVHLNTVGDAASRTAYRASLMQFLKPHFLELSADSQTRFEKNPLRILDSKDPKDQEILMDAPSILDSLSDAAKEHFDQLCASLDDLGIVYRIDPKIVRGLDYYNKTVFEVVSDSLGAQSTIGAGGRYDGLMHLFGGPDLPGVGFATGLERVLQVMIAQGMHPPKTDRPFIYFIPLGDQARAKSLKFVTHCRHQGISASIELNTQKIQTALQNAARLEAVYAAIIGTDELEKGVMQLKKMSTRETREVPFAEWPAFLKSPRE